MRITKATAILEAYTPGEQPKSKTAVKLNTNENPYPPSPKCAKVLKDFDLDKLRRYPDPVFAELREEIAELNGAKPENVFVGNGSDEILTLAARAFVENDELIGSLDPSYSLYKTLAAIRDVKWIGSPVDSPKIDIPGNVSLFLWTNPNAPTGGFASPKKYRRLPRSLRAS
jgi:histidinol-phosphate aminotransferase